VVVVRKRKATKDPNSPKNIEPIENLEELLLANQGLRFTGESTRESGCKFTDIPGSK
jgi:hypothetical protein